MMTKAARVSDDLPGLDEEPTMARGFADSGAEPDGRDERFDDFDGQARTAVMRQELLQALAQSTRGDVTTVQRRPTGEAGRATPPAMPVVRATPPAMPVPVVRATPPAMPILFLPVDLPADGIEEAFADEPAAPVASAPAARRHVGARLLLVALALAALGAHHEVRWPDWTQRLLSRLHVSAVIGR
jgi:hypothetical protein